MGFAPGTRVGPYEIQSLLGSGGMGEVYRAVDTRLGRLVAVKVLRAEHSQDPEYQSRLLKEARAASALQHPNILTLHDILSEQDRTVLVFEHVAGQTLDSLIRGHGLLLSAALRYAVQIASALAAAHASSIVHRDVKPSNVMITRDGSAKVLDFGLAKDLERTLDIGGDYAHTVRIERGPDTRSGVIVGTLSYMSPEQAQGKRVVPQSDIFSFGCVLYEMLTGQQAFQGNSPHAIRNALLHKEPPPPSSLRPEVRPELEKIVLRCLRKDPSERWQSMAEVGLALEELKKQRTVGLPEEHAGPGRRPRRLREPQTVAAVLGLGLLASVVGWTFLSRRQEAVAFNPTPLTSNPGLELSPTFSPDGNQVAYAWNGPERNNFDIYVKLIGAGEPLRLTTDAALDYSPAWSPDGRYVAFLRLLPTGSVGIMLVPALGGAERKLVETRQGTRLTVPGSTLASGAATWLLAWSPDSEWLVAPDAERTGGAVHLIAVSVTSGERRRLTSPPAGASIGDLNPAVSPDGSALAFNRSSTPLVSDLMLLSLSSTFQAAGEPKQITSDGRWTDQPSWSADGRSLVFLSNRAGTRGLWRMEIGGEPVLISAAVEGMVTPSVSRAGNRLAYARVMMDSDLQQLQIPRSGQVTSPPVAVGASSMADRSPQFSPDGRRIAFQSARSGTLEIWTMNSDGSHPVQLTHFGRGHTGSPRWSPDGLRIAFDSNQAGSHADVYVVNAEGGSPQRLTEGPGDNVLPSWSTDGQWIYFCSQRTGEPQIWKMKPSGSEARLVLRGGGRIAIESPDSQWLYFRRDDLPGPIWRISTAGGPEEVVVNDRVVGRNFAVTASGVYYQRIDGPTVSLIWTRPGESATRLLYAMPRRVDQGLTVSPDEKRLLFSDVAHETSNILLVDNFR